MGEIGRPYLQTGGTSDSALASTTLPTPELGWFDAIERMLEWRNSPETFAPEDRIDIGVLDSAIDLAVDYDSMNQPVPSSIVPSGSGCIAFEWNAGSETMIIELTGVGRATVTRFEDGRVVYRGVLLRDPKTRKLQLEA